MSTYRVGVWFWAVPELLQDIELSGVRFQSCLVYLDEVIVFSDSEKDNIVDVDSVLSLLKKAGITLDFRKCSFFKPKVDYLGHVFMFGKLGISTDGTKAVRESTFPATKTQSKTFLVAAGVYRRFIANFARIARPLTELLKDDYHPCWEETEEKERDSFEALKQSLVEPPVLALPKRGRPYLVDTDASTYAIGAALFQKQDYDNPNQWATIGFWSKTLSQCEFNYSTTERE